ncbi:hypothetical protein BD770DRAFT_416346 [Pilaira anomala]|nr:hypothetical protein BD770DRAFT_416346 [Pilaira anomala]
MSNVKTIIYANRKYGKRTEYSTYSVRIFYIEYSPFTVYTANATENVKYNVYGICTEYSTFAVLVRRSTVNEAFSIYRILSRILRIFCEYPVRIPYFFICSGTPLQIIKYFGRSPYTEYQWFNSRKEMNFVFASLEGFRSLQFSRNSVRFS